jgi:hypothetical protein
MYYRTLPCPTGGAVIPRVRNAAIGIALALAPCLASATPPGWTNDLQVFVSETSGADLSDYQVRLVVDTATLIADGKMRPDAGDLRFAGDAGGTQPLPYWIEGGVNTASTVVWVRVPSIPANWATGFHLFSGNPAATSESTLDVFGFVDEVENSSTNQVSNGSPGGVTESQRGFRFHPNEDVLLTHLGKREPNGTDRYITLFDADTQALIVQDNVSGPAAEYTYKPLAQPIWLVRDKQYLLEMYQGSADGYYFGPSTQINPRLTYHDMRYCNGCTKDTFPQNHLDAIHYGYPDFLFRTRKQASSEPTVSIGGRGPTRTLLTASAPGALVGEPVTFTASVLALLPHAPGSTFSFRANGNPVAGCTGLAPSGTDPLTAPCTIDTLPLGESDIEVSWSGDDANVGSVSDLLPYTVVRRASQTSLAANPPGSEFGTPVTFTATATATAVLGQAPAGTFSFVADGSPLGGCTDLPPAGTNPPTATCTTNALLFGIHHVTASWTGDDYHEGSASDVLAYEVARLSTRTLLATGCAPVFVENQPLALHAAVTGTFMPIGSVRFEQNGATLCQGVPLVAGMATCVASNLVTGGQPMSPYSFTASYTGDDVNAPSTSVMLGITVLSEAEAVMHDGFDPIPAGCPSH